MHRNVTTQQFLEWMLPSGCNYAINFSKYTADAARKPKFHQRVVPSIPELIKLVRQRDADGFNVYYGMASYHQGWHTVTNDSGKEEKRFRTKANVQLLRAFWLDVDIRPGEAGKHPDLKSAITALNKLVTGLRLPKPILVHSGGGLHVYWRLDEEITPDIWQPIAQKLVACTRYSGLLADMGCTINSACILRPVGTMRIKDDTPRPVKLLSPLTSYPLATFERCLNAAITRHNIPLSTLKKSNDAHVPEHIRGNPVLAEMYKQQNPGMVFAEDKKNAQKIISRCMQMQESPHLGYGDGWLLSIPVFRVCENGEEEAIKHWSQGAKFDETYAREKLNNCGLGDLPTLCSTFDLANPGICPSCPYYNQVNTPATLGSMTAAERRQIPTVTVPASQPQNQQVEASEDDDDDDDEAANSFALPITELLPNGPLKIEGRPISTLSYYPLLDWRFFNDPDIGARERYLEDILDEDGKKTGEKQEKIRTLFPSCVYMVGCIEETVSIDARVLTYLFLRVSITGDVQLCRLASDTCSSPLELATWLQNNKMTPDPKFAKNAGDFMRAYINKVQNIVETATLTGYFGWDRDHETFTLGDRLIRPGKKPMVISLPTNMQKLSESLTARGSLENWKAVPDFYSKNNLHWGEFFIAGSFASVLLEIAPGMADNGIMSLFSKSGHGKSFAHRASASVWGNPKTQMLPRSATENSRYHYMGVRHHLPIYFSEITHQEPQVLAAAILDITEGQEKLKMRRGGDGLLNTGSWTTMTKFSSNISVFDKMMDLGCNRTAEIYRVVEIPVPETTASKIEADEMKLIMDENYGVAGAAFIQLLLDRPDVRKWAIRQISVLVNNLMDGRKTGERYWANIVACTLIAAAITNRMGITSFNLPAMKAFALQTLSTMRYQLEEVNESIKFALSEFLADHQRGTLVVTRHQPPAGLRTMASFQRDAYIIQAPSDTRIAVRIELEDNCCYIRNAVLKDWCKKRGMTMEEVLSGVEHSRGTHRISAGLPTDMAERSACYCIVVAMSKELEEATGTAELVS